MMLSFLTLASDSLASVGHHKMASRSRLWVGRLGPLKKKTRVRAPLRMRNLGKVRCYDMLLVID